MYAIIVTGGKQYKVSEGDEIKVEKLDVEPSETLYCFPPVTIIAYISYLLLQKTR